MTNKQKDTLAQLVIKYNKVNKYPITPDLIIDHCKRYIKASKDNRIICNIDKVSTSGMSRTMKFVELSKSKSQHYILNFYQLFEILGFTKVKDSNYFRINGCGMDMVFATHYNIIADIHTLGLITKKAQSVLEQKTPHCI